MFGSSVRFTTFCVFVALSLSACGPGAPSNMAPDAVGFKTELGRTLTSSHWCTPLTDVEATMNPTFVELEVRQNGQYIKTLYKMKFDNSLDRTGEERGTWAVVGDQFFTRAVRTAQTRQKATVRTKDAPSERAETAEVTKRGAGETCMNLSDSAGVIQAYCSCNVN